MGCWFGVLNRKEQLAFFQLRLKGEEGRQLVRDIGEVAYSACHVTHISFDLSCFSFDVFEGGARDKRHSRL